VVDAVSGAIYVIGGDGLGGTYLHDVWASTDGGARAGVRKRGGVTAGVLGPRRGSWG
jgi:hypothetical protein